ncbi:iron-siderophore ABC transporter substrate-binding protein, partial [Mesorhizobium sp. M7D.F.Ca.US.004.03.1.1]
MAVLESHRADRLRGRITRRGALGLFVLSFAAIASPSAAAKPL